MSQKAPRTYFVTGFPGFVAEQMVAHLAREASKGMTYLLVESRFVEAARAALNKRDAKRFRILTGDVVDMHLGLSGEEYQKLCCEVTHIFHLAACTYLGAPREQAFRVNVEGTRNVIELGRDCQKLERLSYFSTCVVSGDRVGVIAEDELDCGQGFRNAYEETKFLAERYVQQAAASLPISVFRPGSIVGDSTTGEINRFEGPYYLAILLVASPMTVPLPLPGNGVAPLNVVPIDFVVRAAWQLTHDPRGVGRTFHLVDPTPMSARRVYERIAEKANKKLPKFNLSARAADVVLRLPFLERLSRPQRAAISSVNHLAIFNCYNTLELLYGTGIRCPPLASYLDQLIDYVREYYRMRREAGQDVDDPLDWPIRDAP